MEESAWTISSGKRRAMQLVQHEYDKILLSLWVFSDFCYDALAEVNRLMAFIVGRSQ